MYARLTFRAEVKKDLVLRTHKHLRCKMLPLMLALFVGAGVVAGICYKLITAADSQLVQFTVVGAFTILVGMAVLFLTRNRDQKATWHHFVPVLLVGLVTPTALLLGTTTGMLPWVFHVNVFVSFVLGWLLVELFLANTLVRWMSLAVVLLLTLVSLNLVPNPSTSVVYTLLFWALNVVLLIAAGWLLEHRVLTSGWHIWTWFVLPTGSLLAYFVLLYGTTPNHLLLVTTPVGFVLGLAILDLLRLLNQNVPKAPMADTHEQLAHAA